MALVTAYPALRWLVVRASATCTRSISCSRSTSGCTMAPWWRRCRRPCRRMCGVRLLARLQPRRRTVRDLHAAGVDLPHQCERRPGLWLMFAAYCSIVRRRRRSTAQPACCGDDAGGGGEGAGDGMTDDGATPHWAVRTHPNAAAGALLFRIESQSRAGRVDFFHGLFRKACRFRGSCSNGEGRWRICQKYDVLVVGGGDASRCAPPCARPAAELEVASNSTEAATPATPATCAAPTTPPPGS